MKNPLEQYFQLMHSNPALFKNSGEVGEIRIITNKKRILAEQKKIRARLKKEGNPPHWIDIGVLSEDQWFYVIRDMVEFPGGGVGGYIRWVNRKSTEGGGFYSVLMCVQEDNVLMIRKFHHEDRKWNWEFPRGFGEPERSAEKNAKMELWEELGVRNAKLTCLTKVKEGKGGIAVFLVEIPKDQKVILDIVNFNYRWVKMSKLDQIVKKGLLNDWFSLWAYSLSFRK